MINRIIDAISLTINDEFNATGKDNYKIYTEEVRQGLKTPCFFINALDPSEDLFRGNRYKQINQFCIQFIPSDSSNDKKYKCNEVREILYSILEYITIIEIDEEGLQHETLIRGNQMHGEYVDGALNFFVNYDMFVKKKEAEINKMESCDYNSKVTEGD